jgi:hypothetical protein
VLLYVVIMEVKMRILGVGVLVAGLFVPATLVRSEPCPVKVYGPDGKLYCGKATKAPARSESGLTAAERESLDRAHTRSLLESIDRRLRNLRNQQR